MKIVKHLFVVVILTTLFTACRKETINNMLIDQPLAARTLSNGGIAEDFETGSKTSYANANVTLGTGSWAMNDALIGNTTSDRKVGTASARVRNTGKVEMNFNFANGASTVTVSHAKYGSDGNSNWELWMSTNSGSSWTKVGSTVTTSSTSLSTASFNVNVSGNVRFSIRKTSGGTYRINIDEITINPYSTSGGGTVPGDNDNLLMGNPSNAVADAFGSPNNYLMNKTYYVMSYSRDRATPNWVSWHIYSGDLGSTPRQDDFRADASLPAGWYQVGATSYSGSGFDRGHNCPSADRTLTVAANSSTFLMSNMIPQAPYNNQQTWNNMESYVRSLVTAGNEVYVIMGSYGVGGTGSNGTFNTIDAGRITVPNRVWKVVVVLPNGNGDLSRVTTSTRVIAVNTPNTNSISTDWKLYRTSVDAIESATGYNLLSNVSSSIQSVIESVVDNQ
ncbi:MAG TPA: DNA/RNA non-specific endonuclease [Chitinophagaceae bacterium]